MVANGPKHRLESRGNKASIGVSFLSKDKSTLSETGEIVSDKHYLLL